MSSRSTPRPLPRVAIAMLYLLALLMGLAVLAWSLQHSAPKPSTALGPFLSVGAIISLSLGHLVVLWAPNVKTRRRLGLPITLVGIILGLGTLWNLGPDAKSITDSLQRLPEVADRLLTQWSAWAILCMGLSLFALVLPRAPGRWSRQVSAAVACGMVGISLIPMLEALAGVSSLYPAYLTFSQVGTGGAFLALGIGVVISAGWETWPLALIYPDSLGDSGEWPKGYLRAMLFSLIGLLLLGSMALRRWMATSQRRAQSELASIAETKTRILASWFADRDQETRRIFQGPKIRTLLGAYLTAAPGAPGQGVVDDWLGTLQIGAYQRVLLTDAQGRHRGVAPAGADTELSPVESQGLAVALNSRTIQFLDLHASNGQADLRMNWWIPVQDPQPGKACHGALLVQVDAARWLFPLLESWPMASSSAETLLVRREGPEVVFLSGLRHQHGNLLRLPLATHPEMPATLAAKGREGFVRGTDYRGTEVLAEVARIPGTPWFLVAKMDESELYAPLRFAAWVIGFIALMGLAVMALALGGLARHKDARQMKRLLELEREKSALEVRYAGLMDQASDAILVVDLEGQIQEANQAACRMYGLDAQVLKGMPILALRAPESREQLAEQFAQVKRGEPVCFESMHLGSGGIPFAVEVSSRLVQLSARPAVLSFIRDISERKRNETEILRLMRLYEALSQVNQAIVLSPDRTMLLATICRVLVERGKFKMAWIAWDDPQTHEVSAVAEFGDVTGHLARARVRSDDSLEGRGPLGTALRTGTSQFYNRYQDVPADYPWLAEAKRAGFKASGAIPIRSKGKVVGAIAIHSADEGFFGPQEIALLEEAAGDVGFALDHFDSQEQRRQAEAALRTSEEKFYKTFQSAPLLSSLTDLNDGELLEVNDLFCGVLGYGREEVLGRTSLELGILRPEVREQIVSAVHTQGRVQNLEISLYRKDGQVVNVFFSGEILELSGRVILLAMSADITQLKQSEAKRRALQNEVEHLQKLDSLGRLAGGIAHDMNNVLAAVLAVTQTTRARHLENVALGNDLAIVERAVVRGRDLVKGLLDFSRKELSTQTAIDLNQLVRQEVALLERTLRQKYRLVTDLHEPLPLVLGETGLLGSALMNLCINAVDAMSQDGTLTIRTRWLPEGFVEMCVEDTGVGMSPEVLTRAMEPFFTTKAPGKGTGLGLAMVYNTARTHGGTLTLHSQEGQGTQVLLRLPCLSTPMGVPTVGTDPSSGSQPMNILLVDDDELIRASMPAMLGALGHVVETLDGGRAALARLGEGPSPDCVILDMNMPEMNGLETLRRIRLSGNPLPVLIASGYLDSREAEVIKTDGCVLSITKPFSLDEIKGKLAQLAAKARAPKERQDPSKGSLTG